MLLENRVRKTSSLSLLTLLFAFFTACQSPKVNPAGGSISNLENDPNPNAKNFVGDRSPQLLSLSELTSFLDKSSKNSLVVEKAKRLFSSPFIDNSFYKKNGIPKHHHYPSFGDALRITTWNIEKSINIDEVAKMLRSKDHFKASLSPKVLKKKNKYEQALEQRAMLAASDVLFLQEMDIGHCRSDYLFAAKHLAESLEMNFVYAPQQLEIDPVYLGVEDAEVSSNEKAGHVCEVSGKHSTAYKGVFGVAVLSRYPIKRVQVFPLKNHPYDWHTGEIQKPDFLEKLRRFSSEKIFKFKPVREMKTGGRGFTRVDLHVPGLPHETLSVINIHLEIKATPKHRHEQLEETLGYIKKIKNPVVMAGDFNNASRDLSSTSIVRASVRSAKDPQNLLTTAFHLANVTVVSQIRTIFNGLKNFKNPLASNIPVIFPNKKKSLFKLVENFRFEDGGAFDFRGDKQRSTNGNVGTLSNSNQRTWYKGFTFTFSAPRPVGPIGQDRLDWIFVKSFLTNPKDKSGPYRLAPHFGETLGLLNTAVKSRYSDHHPITTLLPLKEPKR